MGFPENAPEHVVACFPIYYCMKFRRVFFFLLLLPSLCVCLSAVMKVAIFNTIEERKVKKGGLVTDPIKQNACIKKSLCYNQEKKGKKMRASFKRCDLWL